MNPLFSLLIAACVLATSCTHQHAGYIIKSNASNDGISVVYATNNDTFALDYLTQYEYDSLVATFNRPYTAHACKWSLCPYQGIKAAQYEHAVGKYVGEACTDAYHIDMLHLQYPTEEYEQLEARLIPQH